jgi:tyrosine-protein kinase Etk/Wzc
MLVMWIITREKRAWAMPSNLPSESERYLPVVESAGDHPSAHSVQHAAQDGLNAALPLDADTGINLRRYLEAVRRYRWGIIATIVLGTAAGVGIGAYIPARYETQATIWVEVPSQGESGQGPIQADQLLHAAAWIDLLRSYTVLDHVVTDMRLYLQPANPGDSILFAGFRLKEQPRPGSYILAVGEDGRGLTLKDRKGELLQAGVVGDSIGQELGFLWVPPARELQPNRVVRFSVSNPREIARQLGQKLTSQMQTGQFLRIGMTGTSPQKISATVNAVAERYVTVAAELKNAKLNEQAALLYEQLRRAEENLREADNELESFRIATITVPTERATPVAPGLLQTHDPVFTNFFNMKIEQDQLRRDREAIERALGRAGTSAPLSVAALEYIGAVQNSSELLGALQVLSTRRAELRALRNQYTDEYPSVRALSDDIRTMEGQTIPFLARNLIAELNNRDAQIEDSVRAASAELQRIPARQLEEARLTRQMRMAEELHNSLRMRFETARLAAASSIPDVRILESALAPQRPVVEMRVRIILLAFAGSLVLGVLGAILRDRFDPRLRYPEQVTQGLKLNIIGAIPHTRGPGAKGPGKNALQVIEAFRELRLSLVHAHGAAGPLVTVVSSSGSGDGKSFISGNLALSFAEQGHRTLLIDGDIRRGAQHRLLGVTGKPGLTDYLKGKATLEEAVRPTSYPLLHLLPCGARLQGGVELLGSPRMVELLRELRARFQVIVIDSPPLGAGVDPFVLSTLAGNVMLVLRTDYTDRQYTEAKLALLDRLPVRVLGAVLNAVPPRGVYRYYSYLPGYSEVGEGEGLVVAGDHLASFSG